MRALDEAEREAKRIRAREARLWAGMNYLVFDECRQVTKINGGAV